MTTSSHYQITPGFLQDSFGLTGKTVLITGATGHLGAAMAFGIAAAGGRVLAHGRNADKLATLVSTLNAELPLAYGGSHDGVLVDLLAEDADGQLLAAVAKYTGSKAQPAGCLHGLVNNAFAHSAYWQAVNHLVNILPNLLVEGLLPAFGNSVAHTGDAASVVNIATMYAHVSPDLSLYDDARAQEQKSPPAYGVAKAGLVQLSRYQAWRYGKAGVRVNSLSPGPFPTDKTQKDHRELCKRLASRTALGRLGEAPEVARAVVFLLSPAASYITATDLKIDAGWTAR